MMGSGSHLVVMKSVPAAETPSASRSELPQAIDTLDMEAFISSSSPGTGLPVDESNSMSKERPRDEAKDATRLMQSKYKII